MIDANELRERYVDLFGDPNYVESIDYTVELNRTEDSPDFIRLHHLVALPNFFEDMNPAQQRELESRLKSVCLDTPIGKTSKYLRPNESLGRRIQTQNKILRRYQVSYKELIDSVDAALRHNAFTAGLHTTRIYCPFGDGHYSNMDVMITRDQQSFTLPGLEYHFIKRHHFFGEVNPDELIGFLGLYKHVKRIKKMPNYG